LFRATVDVALIREQWDQLVRIASSLRNRTAPAHVVLERLASSSPTDRLAKALTMLLYKCVHGVAFLQWVVLASASYRG
jgi:TnpA family transposase